MAEAFVSGAGSSKCKVVPCVAVENSVLKPNGFAIISEKTLRVSAKSEPL